MELQKVENEIVNDEKYDILKGISIGFACVLSNNHLKEIYNEIDILRDSNYKNIDLFKQKIGIIFKNETYINAYGFEIPLEKKQKITNYLLLTIEERRVYLDVNEELIYYLKASIFQEYFSNLFLAVNNIDNPSKYPSYRIIPKKKERDEIYDLIENNPEKFNIPSRFIDPITKSIMEDPVFCAFGYTYDRNSITNWLKNADTTPVSGMRLFVKTLTPNLSLKSDLKEYLEKLKSNLNKKRKIENDNENENNKKIKI